MTLISLTTWFAVAAALITGAKAVIAQGAPPMAVGLTATVVCLGLGLSATWIESDVRTIPSSLDGSFDLVVTTYGTFGWLPSLVDWAEGIARALRPGGRFVICDGHPVALAIDEEAAQRGELALRWPVGGGARVETVRTRLFYARKEFAVHAQAMGVEP
jgi:SAM-dependent methyltransferase